jgi:hypothetical protein
MLLKRRELLLIALSEFPSDNLLNISDARRFPLHNLLFHSYFVENLNTVSDLKVSPGLNIVLGKSG